MNSQPDGHFPGREPEPVREHLEDLGRLVRAADADVGIAHDGDADRAIFFDETGEYVEGDAALAALAEAELGEGDTTVSAVNVSQRLVDVCERTGAELELTPIGSTQIMTRIRQLEADADRTTIDGYRLDYGDSWVLVRPSGTEPVVRIYAEAADEERAEELAGEFATALRAAKAGV